MYIYDCSSLSVLIYGLHIIQDTCFNSFLLLSSSLQNVVDSLSMYKGEDAQEEGKVTSPTDEHTSGVPAVTDGDGK